MSALDHILITHFRNSDRSNRTAPLAKLEPFVRAFAAWRGDEDTAWNKFQEPIQRLIEEQGEAFLPAVIVEAGLSNYSVDGQPYETPERRGEGYSQCQRALRRLSIPRLENLEAETFNKVLETFKHRLTEHGLGCYGIGTNSELLVVLIARDPIEFENAAEAAGIELDTAWDW